MSPSDNLQNRPHIDEHPEQEARRDAVLTEFKEHLFSQNWQERECTRCGRQYYAKSKSQSGLCGKQECNGNEFLSRPAPKNFLPPQEVADGFARLFADRNYAVAHPIPIISKHGNNLFVGTAGQIFDEVIHREGQMNTAPMFVTQPVIRLQSEPIVGQVDGYTTSFINTSTEHLQATPADHLGHIEDWLTALSQLGIYVGDITIRMKKDNPDWGRGQFRDAVMSFYYKGLEIAYANYFIDVPQASRDSVSISDVSFGLERVLWAINKSPSYFQGVGPLHMSFDHRKHKGMDSIRTAVLMSASGVEPGHKDRGSKLRMFSRHIALPGEEFPENLVRYYYQWWNQFSSLPHTEARVLHSMRNEWARTVNLSLQRNLHAPENIPIEMLPDEYIRILVRRGITLQKIMNVLNDPHKAHE